MEGFAILWLLFNTTIGQWILGIFIVIVLACWLGWWTIPVVIALIVLLYIGNIIEKEKWKKHEEEERQYKMRLKYLTEDVNEKKQKRQKKQLSKAEVVAEVAKLKDSRPDAIIREIGDYKDTRAYWLMIGKGRQKRETLDCKIFTIKFAIAEDGRGMKMTITNTSEGIIRIEWKSLKINNRAAYIDGILRSKYEVEGSLTPREVVTKLLQMRKEYYGNNLVVMFNLDEIDKEELRYEVSMDITDENRDRKSFTFDVSTKIQIISNP